MNAPAIMMEISAAEGLSLARFREAELASVAERSPGLDEMIEACLQERDSLERSARAAETAYGAAFHPTIIRRCAVLQRVAEFLGLVAQHKEEVGPILRGQAPAQRKKRA